MHTPEFIFMLTRNDSTVPDAQARLPEVLAAGVKHIGFKDIGQPLDQLKQLAQAIHAGGATAYLEVVSLDEESEMNSARAALELGVDVLMGERARKACCRSFVSLTCATIRSPAASAATPACWKVTLKTLSPAPASAPLYRA
ncbi:hypothetical protein [Serratia marcescens]|uniref:hypothetical protein n=1 Tax=Serratia marcescens TaxID=615 RepID=UPI00298D6441|nr:hypothetical protein [Serratia marcescens]WPC48637.1 hypothetical protein Q9K10_08900 [Serratia marcescens]